MAHTLPPDAAVKSRPDTNPHKYFSDRRGAATKPCRGRLLQQPLEACCAHCPTLLKRCVKDPIAPANLSARQSAHKSLFYCNVIKERRMLLTARVITLGDC